MTDTVDTKRPRIVAKETETTEAETMKEAFEETRVEDVAVTKGKVHTLSAEDTVETALEVLVANSIISAPVRETHDGKYLGFLDMLDLVQLISHTCRRESTHDVADLTNDDIQMLMRRDYRFNKETCAQVTDLSKRNPFRPVNEGASLVDAVRVFAEGVHRVPIVNDRGDIVGLLTQSDIIRFVARNIHLLKENASKPVSAVGHMGGVISVAHDTNALTAFETLLQRGVSAVAIVGASGAIVGNLSATDLKGLSEHRFLRLLLPVSDFVHAVRRDSIDDMNPVIGVPATTRLKDAIQRLHATKLHRLWLVDSEMRPSGLISLTDVARELLKE